MKAAARRSQNCIMKTKKYVLWNAGVITEILWMFLMQNFIEIGQSAAELWPKKRFLKWRPTAILYFKNVQIWSHDCRRVPNVLLHRISSKSDDFLLRYGPGDLTIFKMADVWHLEF